MAEKKPASGKAVPRQRAPRTSTKNQPLAAPIMENEDNADSLRKALSESESRQASLPEGWKPLGQPKTETSTQEIESKPANLRFTPSDLARKYSMVLRGDVRSPNTLSSTDINSAKERAQSYMKVAATQPPRTVGQRVGVPYTPPAGARQATRQFLDEEAARPQVRSTSGFEVDKMLTTPGQQLQLRKARPEIAVGRALPQRNALDIKSDGTVTVTPVQSAPGSPEVLNEQSTKSFAPNETNITSEEYRRHPEGLGHMVDGQHASAFTKHTVHYRRTNNNGVAGLLKIGENQHSGTFYTHPETGEVVQTNAKPVPAQYSAIELHHAELYRKHGQAHAAQISQKYGKPVFKNADGTPLNAAQNAKAIRNSIAGTTDSLNWARETLPKAIQSSRNGDVAGTMAALKADPDSIHELFHDHFYVAPAKEKAYTKAVKAGVLPHIDPPHVLMRKKQAVLDQSIRPYEL